MTIAYTTSAKAYGGRAGTAKSDDGVLDVTLTTPKELGGDGAEGTNPEQLFAAGYAACFLGALKFVASQEKIAIPEDAFVTATVGIGPREGGFQVHPEIVVTLPGIETAIGEDLVAKAHLVCPYSHLARTPLEVSATLAS